MSDFVQQGDLTVVIPVLNGLPLLARAVDSLKAQTSSNWRAMIVDNCSDDQDLPIYLQRLDERFDIRFRIERLDAIDSFYEALMEVTSPLVCFLAHDDVLDPDYVRELTQELNANPHLDGVCPKICTFSEEDPNQATEVSFKLDWTKPRNGLPIRYLIGSNFKAVNAWYGVYRTEALQVSFQRALASIHTRSGRSDQSIVAFLLTNLVVSQSRKVCYRKHRPQHSHSSVRATLENLSADFNENSERVNLVVGPEVSRCCASLRLRALVLYSNLVWTGRVLLGGFVNIFIRH